MSLTKGRNLHEECLSTPSMKFSHQFSDIKVHAIGIIHSTAPPFKRGHTTKAVSCIDTAKTSNTIFIEYLGSMDSRPNALRIPGIMHIAFMSMAPLITSSSGKMNKTSSAIPMAYSVSITKA